MTIDEWDEVTAYMRHGRKLGPDKPVSCARCKSTIHNSDSCVIDEMSDVPVCRTCWSEYWELRAQLDNTYWASS